MDNKTPEKKIEPVVQNEVKISQKSKIKESFISKDGKTIKNYAVFDVLIPSIKRVFYDLVNKVLSMTLFGDGNTRPNGSGPYDYNKPYQTVSYGGQGTPYRPYNQPVPPRPKISSGSGFDYENFIFESRGDAEAVLMQMTDVIESFGVVTVSDLYDMVRKQAPYTSENYGWKNLSGAKVGLVSEGFNLILPPVKPINS